MAWKGEVPLLGFENEYHADMWVNNNKRLLYVPVPFFGTISIYAWSSTGEEGYNMFWPPECPIKRPTGQARDPFTVKMIIQAYLNDVQHFKDTGEIRNVDEIYASGSRTEA